MDTTAPRPRKRLAIFRTADPVLTPLIKACGYSAILFVIMIFVFLWSEGFAALGEVSLKNLFSARWYPIEEYFGLLPLIGGSLLVTLGAALFAVPIGVLTAVYISVVAPRWMREVLKPVIEILGGLPSVVLGFLGILVLAPFLRKLLDLPTGLTALAGSILLGAISIPTIVSIAEDALDAVPRSYREGAWALGATRWQTIWRVLIPTAMPGIMTAVILAMARAIGETMAVQMVIGNTPLLANSLFSPTATLTSEIVVEMGNAPFNTAYGNSLFLMALVLLIMSLLLIIVIRGLIRKGEAL